MLNRNRPPRKGRPPKASESHIESGACESDHCPAPDNVSRWFCLHCSAIFCEECWDGQIPHRPGKVVSGHKHEKTDVDVKRCLDAIFQPPEDEHELQTLHQEDEATLWFGVQKRDDKAFLYDTLRFSSLMADTRREAIPNTDRFPLLVSFVGVTGAGKSTLIKLLVELKQAKQRKSSVFPSPVVGSVKNDYSPTSGDVHLYIDPQTASDDLPMLYADCEGLLGGNTPPRASKLREASQKVKERIENMIDRNREIREPTTEKEQGVREFAVRRIYPRLLYTFSDVVVFVLDNARTFESSALGLLLDWASCAFQSSINQPTLPHAIIVINACHPSLDDEDWNTEIATEKLFKHVEKALLTGSLRKYYDRWVEKGRNFKSTKDLLKCYYQDIKVIRVPNNTRYTLVKRQADELYLQLLRACTESLEFKVAARQACTTGELSRYLKEGFDHFAEKPTGPFNFLDVAFKSNPLPQRFSDHILKLALAASSQHDYRDWFQAFIRLTPIIASCIIVDCIRYNRKGHYLSLFDQHYKNSCEAALDRYHSQHVHCTFVSRKGKACANSRLGHGKGHQSVKGGPLTTGPFQTDRQLADVTKEFLALIKTDLSRMDDLINQRGVQSLETSQRVSDDLLIYNLHRDNLTAYYSSYQTNLIDRNTSTCYACLMDIPQHLLPCGHLLCTTCVKMLGCVENSNSVIIASCPLENGESPSPSPITIRFKPEFAGVRALSLDGGGIRGIVELEVLRTVQLKLGQDLPIQLFFDLIVGTSTGGIIALGLGAKQWSIDKCLERFIQMCKEAFQPQRGSNIPIVGKAIPLLHRGIYKSTPFRELLQRNFESDLMRTQAPNSASRYDVKVAVTTASLPNDEAIVIGNYLRRPAGESHWYIFRPPSCREIWEAAAATSAAPIYYKRFSYQPSCKCCPSADYIDGAVWYNNPVMIANNESQLLFPDVASKHPDLLLSIGTGMNAAAINMDVQRQGLSNISISSPALRVPETVERSPDSSRLDRLISAIRDGKKMMAKRIDNILDAELQFKRFKDFVEQRASEADITERYVRLNVDVEQSVPALDDVASLDSLQRKVRSQLTQPAYTRMVTNIVHMMIASTFYFVKKTEQYQEMSLSSLIYKGRLACRFEGSTTIDKDRVRCLGRFLQLQATSTFRPFFTVKNRKDDVDFQKIILTKEVLEEMIDSATFNTGDEIAIKLANQQTSVTIFLCLSMSPGVPQLFPISGFPRKLGTESASNVNGLQESPGNTGALSKNKQLVASISLMREKIEQEQSRLHDLAAREDHTVVDKSDSTRNKTSSSHARELYRRDYGNDAAISSNDNPFDLPILDDSDDDGPTEDYVLNVLKPMNDE